MLRGVTLLLSMFLCSSEDVHHFISSGLSSSPLAGTTFGAPRPLEAVADADGVAPPKHWWCCRHYVLATSYPSPPPPHPAPPPDPPPPPPPPPPHPPPVNSTQMTN